MNHMEWSKYEKTDTLVSSSSEETGTEIDQNPMSVSVFASVLENELLWQQILQNLLGPTSRSPRDLGNCRLINQKLSPEATKCLQKNNWENRNFIIIRDGHTLKNYLETFAKSPDHMLHSCFRFDTQYRVWCWYYGSKLNTGTEDIDRFLQTFSQGIKSLSLDLNLDCNSRTLQGWLEKLSPSLEELRVSIPRQSENLDDKLDLRFWLNLSYLCLTQVAEYLSLVPIINNPQFLNVLEMVLSKTSAIVPGKPLKICLMQAEGVKPIIKLLTKYNHVKNLKVFDIKNIRRGEIDALTELGSQIKLQFLAIDATLLQSTDEDFQINENERFFVTREIYQFLCSQAANLEMLDWQSAAYFKFPECGMRALKKLRLRLWKCYVPISAEGEALLQTIPRINYGQFFPNLKELELLSTWPESVEFKRVFITPDNPCTSVRKLKLKYLFLSAEILRSIFDTFPFITSLEIHINQEKEKERQIYAIIWNNPNFVVNLQELTCYVNFGAKNNKEREEFEFDSLFAGVDVATIRQVSKSQGYADFEFPDGSSSILNLTNLKKFSIINSADRYKIRKCGCPLTDFTVFCVFGRMNKLKFLHLEQGIRKFSRSAIDHLKSKDELVSDDNVHHKGSSFPTSFSAENRIEEVFRTGFTFERVNGTKSVNLIDRDLPDSVYDSIFPPDSQTYFSARRTGR